MEIPSFFEESKAINPPKQDTGLDHLADAANDIWGASGAAE